MQYWLTNPTLTPDHDWKCDAGALADWTRGDWEIREDQSDPAPGVALPADPRPPAEEPATVDEQAADDEPTAVDATETPAAVVAPETKTTTTKKGN